MMSMQCPLCRVNFSFTKKQIRKEKFYGDYWSIRSGDNKYGIFLSKSIKCPICEREVEICRVLTSILSKVGFDKETKNTKLKIEVGFIYNESFSPLTI